MDIAIVIVSYFKDLAVIETIRDYYQISEHLATSGQPTPAEFTSIAQGGYQAVINLATSHSTNALVNEGVIVTDLEMVYLSSKRRPSILY